MLTADDLATWACEARERFELTTFDLRLVEGDILLAAVHISDPLRGQGRGTAALDALTRLADEYGYRVVLTAPNIRLERFYAQFGFVRNAAPDKDWNLRARMMRMPG